MPRGFNLGMALKSKKESNFSSWYTELIQKADLVDYSPVSGCMVLKPNSYALWEKVQEFFNKKIKKDGVRNAYFPLLIPEKLLTKEAKHVEGFAPEVAWVTHTGKSKLKERLAIRPTSETIMYDSYSKWVRSWKDLPLRYNQWNNVIRWEFKHPTPFLRTREFLWQEGHTVFATKKEADKEVWKILEFYADVFEDLYAVPVLRGLKSEKEKFAGADYTTSLETIMPDGKAIQAATSHHLGQNFAKAFNISFLDKKEKKQYAFQNSWGLSTRSLGILIATHSDNKGLVLPPKIAEHKVVIVPVVFKGKEKSVMDVSRDIKKKLNKYNPIFDDREGYSAGWKFNEWETVGIPVRVEIGPNDVSKKQAVVVRRDTGEKAVVKWINLDSHIKSTLDSMQKELFAKAKKFLESSIVEVNSLNELKKAVSQGKIGVAHWCGSPSSEEKIKSKTGAKSLNGIPSEGICFECGKDCEMEFRFGKSY